MNWTLIKKELRIQDSIRYFAIPLYFIGIMNSIILYSNPDLSLRIFSANNFRVSDIVQLFHYFFITPCLLFLLPVFIGVSCIAYERKINVMNMQMSLPISRKYQLYVKVIICLLLSFVFGGIAFKVFDYLLAAKLIENDIASSILVYDSLSLLKYKNISVLIFPILFTSIGIYTSSISKDPFEAFLLTIPFILISFILNSIVDPLNLLFPLSFSDWKFPKEFINPFAHYLQFILLSITLIFLSYFNFKLYKLKTKGLLFQFIIWSIAIYMIGYFTLWAEFKESISPLKKSEIIKKYESKNKGSKLLWFNPLSQEINRESKHDGIGDIGYNLFKIPNTNKIIFNTSWGLANSSQTREYTKKIVEIDIKNNKTKERNNYFGKLMEIDPQGKYYTFHSIKDSLYYVFKYFPPITSKNILFKFTGINEKESIEGNTQYHIIPFFQEIEKYNDNHFVLRTQNGKMIKIPTKSSPIFFINLDDDYKYFSGSVKIIQDNNYMKFELKDKSFLLEYNSQGKYFQILDSSPDSNSFRLFKNKQYYIKSKRLNNKSCKDIEIIGFENKKQFNIKTDKEEIILFPYNRPFYKGSPVNYDFSYFPNFYSIHTSKDDQYFVFAKVKEKRLTKDGVEYNTHFIENYDIYIFDLLKDKEIKIISVPSNDYSLYNKYVKEFMTIKDPKTLNDFWEWRNLFSFSYQFTNTFSDDNKVGLVIRDKGYVFDLNNKIEYGKYLRELDLKDFYELLLFDFWDNDTLLMATSNAIVKIKLNN